MFTRSKRYAITLIEMLLVIALTTIVLGAVTLYIPKALKKETFEKGVSQIMAKIFLAQEVSLDYQMDVSLVLKESEKGIETKIILQQETSSRLNQSLNQHKEVRGIEEMAFNGIKQKEIELQFEGRTGATSKGKLELFAKNNVHSIVLKGFPNRLQKGKFENYEIKASYPEEILSAI